jgi:hypothetical protein
MPWEVPLLAAIFSENSGSPQTSPVFSMRYVVSKRIVDRTSKVSAPQLTALMIAAGLLVAWAGLCAFWQCVA